MPIRRRNRWAKWAAAAETVGVTGLRFHDLRHKCNTQTAATGASTRELMSRMGHSSSRAALLYQHATEDRELQIASKLSDMIDADTTRATGLPG